MGYYATVLLQPTKCVAPKVLIKSVKWQNFHELIAIVYCTLLY